MMTSRTLIALSVTVALSACGSEADPVSSESSTAQTASTVATAAGQIATATAMPDPVPVDVDPCTLLTREDVASHLKDYTEARRAGGDERRPFADCAHKGGFHGMDSISLSVAGGLDPSQFERYVRGNAKLAGDEDKLETVSGVGDKAFARRGILYVHAEEKTFYIQVSTGDIDTPEARLALAKSLADTVIGRL